MIISNIFLQPEMVHSSCHAISQLVGHTCAWRRVQISVWKSKEAVKRCKSLNEACAGLVLGSGHCSRHQSGGYIDGIRQGHVLGNTLHLLSIALQEIHNITLPNYSSSFKIFQYSFICFSFSTVPIIFPMSDKYYLL